MTVTQSESPAKLQSPPDAGDEQFAPLNLPVINGSFFQVNWTSNEFTVIVSANAPAISKNQLGTIQMPAAMLSMSPHSAKDLHLLLAQMVKSYEARFGSIETDYTKFLVEQESEKSAKPEPNEEENVL